MDCTKENIGWFLVRKDGKTFQIMPGMMFVGTEECDILLLSVSADKRHAVIFYDAKVQHIFIKDLNSVTGTYVNGRRIPEQAYVKLEHSNMLRFGYGPDVFNLRYMNGGVSSDGSSPENRMCLSWSEKSETCKDSSFKTPDLSPTGAISEKVLEKKKKNKLQDSLEDLHDITDHMKSEETGAHKNDPPSFSSLTFRKSSPQVLAESATLSLETSMEKMKANSENNSFASNKSTPETHDSLELHKPEHSMSECSGATAESTGSLAMAFTVPFDSPTPQKDFSIRDSISKYAPKKDAGKVCRQKQACKTESGGKPILKPVLQKFVKASKSTEKIEAPKKRDLGEKTSGNSETNAKLDLRVNEKVGPILSHGASYLIQKMFKGDEMDKDLTTNQINYPKMNNLSRASPEKAVMLNSPAEIERNELTSRNEDARSDTGTYTVDEENSEAVADARRMIDKVFGVASSLTNDKSFEKTSSKHTDNKSFVVEQSRPANVLNKSSEISAQQRNKESHANKEQWIDNRFHVIEDLPVLPGEKYNEEKIVQDDEPIKNISGKEIVAPPRTKRKLPIPPVQKSAGHSVADETLHLSHCLSPNSYNVPQSQLMNSFSSNISSKQSQREQKSEFEKTPASGKGRNLYSSSYAKLLKDNKLTVNNVELLENYGNITKKNMFLSANNDVQLHGAPISVWRRTQRVLSGSDMDLDQMKVETSSVLSDVSVSTEPPSANLYSSSIHSRSSRPHASGPQMKFNRAFALRRARLGLETDQPADNRSVASKDTKYINPQASSNSPSSTSFSRQDGGRFSLRLPKKASKVPANKNVIKPNTVVGKVFPSGPTQKFGHRRTDSDPAKTAFLRKGIDQKMSLSPQNNKTRSPEVQSFQRAVSFSNIGKSDSSVARERLCDQKADRQSMAVLRAIPQICKTGEESSMRDCGISTRWTDRIELSALDNLGIHASLQLSVKLKNMAHNLLVIERDKFTEDSNERHMIDEVLHFVSEETSICSTRSEKGVSQDISCMVKNLKRVQQSLEVLAAIIDEERVNTRRDHPSETEDNFYTESF